LLSALQFHQRNQDTVGLVQVALLSRAGNKQKHRFETSPGIYAIEKAILIGIGALTDRVNSPVNYLCGIIHHAIQPNGNGNENQMVGHQPVLIGTRVRTRVYRFAWAF
jgi:hypothetical protein